MWKVAVLLLKRSSLGGPIRYVDHLVFKGCSSARILTWSDPWKAFSDQTMEQNIFYLTSCLCMHIPTKLCLSNLTEVLSLYEM